MEPDNTSQYTSNESHPWDQKKQVRRGEHVNLSLSFIRPHLLLAGAEHFEVERPELSNRGGWTTADWTGNSGLTLATTAAGLLEQAVPRSGSSQKQYLAGTGTPLAQVAACSAIIQRVSRRNLRVKHFLTTLALLLWASPTGPRDRTVRQRREEPATGGIESNAGGSDPTADLAQIAGPTLAVPAVEVPVQVPTVATSPLSADTQPDRTGCVRTRVPGVGRPGGSQNGCGCDVGREGQTHHPPNKQRRAGEENGAIPDRSVCCLRWRIYTTWPDSRQGLAPW